MAKKRKIYPKEVETKDLHQFLLGSVSPRPIAFVSTVNEEGVANLAPYSFYNAFSSNPPILVFSSNRRVRDNTTKDTLANAIKGKEVVINAVNYDIVRQMALSSVEFDSSISEFEMTGLTPVESEVVRPPAVLESPVNMECVVKDIITLGEHGGAGHLIICEVQVMHILEEVIDENDRINPHKMDLMGRMGRAFYVRASGDAIHTIYQDIKPGVISYTALPDHVKESTILSANDVARLAALRAMPTEDEIKDKSKASSQEEAHQMARQWIQEGKEADALALLMSI
jgi:flavin reductase (DIM6/NTAB) family NADH-FMN oxidoreductase RutF